MSQVARNASECSSSSYNRFPAEIISHAVWLYHLLLVGGSAGLVGLKEALQQRLGCQVLRWERSEFATVLGGVTKATITCPQCGAKMRVPSDKQLIATCPNCGGRMEVRAEIIAGPNSPKSATPTDP